MSDPFLSDIELKKWAGSGLPLSRSHAALIMTHSDIISTCLHWAVNGESGYDARSRAVLCRLAIRLDVKFGFNSV